MVDVAIIGAGVVGAAIARELSRYRLEVVVLEKGYDVACGTSRANSGIVHGGHDAEPGSRKAYFNRLGNPMFDVLSRELDFPFRRNGSLVVAFHEADLPRLEQLRRQGEQNGVEGLSIATGEALRRLEPNLSAQVRAALVVPTGGIVCPYEMTIAYAENAAANGVVFRFNREVTGIARRGGRFVLEAGGEALEARLVVNAAGLHSDALHNRLSGRKLRIVPRKGEYCLLDKVEGGLVRHTVFQLPGPMGKGVLVTPTVDGNILLGPTSYDIDDKADTATTRAGLAEVLSKAALDVDRLPAGSIITSFAGLRAHLEEDDFIVGMAEDVEGLVDVCGIESPGLTSAPAIAKEVEGIVADYLRAERNPGFRPERKAPPRFRHLTNAERRALIARDPAYGQIVCRCETVTRGEIRDALRSPLGIRDLDALKRRTRAGMGRCQAGFCSMRLPEIVAGELGIPVTQVTKAGSGTNLLLHRNKTHL